MRLYRTARGHWAGTQADARAAALDDGAGARDWAEVDVPTDKPGLLAWLNANAGPAALEAAAAERELDRRRDREAAAEARHATRPGDCPKCARAPRAAEALAQGDDVEAIGAWLWRAEPWQVERLFAILGARVGELRR